MRVIRVYQDTILATNNNFDLDELSCHHLLKVLRIKSNQELVLFNGDGSAYPAIINNISKNNVNITIINKINKNNELNKHIHLAQALCKGNKMEYVIQKAVELGVSTITPIISEYSDIKLNAEKISKKLQHWQNIIVTACAQCGRNIIPIIHTPIHFNIFCNNQKNNSVKLILDPKAAQHIKNTGNINNTNVIALIGPEGGFSAAEITIAQQNNFASINIGPRVLRTETAGLAVVSMLQIL
ncbi:MAG: 16S rRNA (uracil(1498)-N(3))-methyltransferase [Legionellales bacterium]|nr:MAG: 16S rRNA (uracil(1498)-N(3))-methyltransferase [Legionellales bacterium]